MPSIDTPAILTTNAGYVVSLSDQNSSQDMIPAAFKTSITIGKLNNPTTSLWKLYNPAYSNDESDYNYITTMNCVNLLTGAITLSTAGGDDYVTESQIWKAFCKFRNKWYESSGMGPIELSPDIVPPSFSSWGGGTDQYRGIEIKEDILNASDMEYYDIPFSYNGTVMYYNRVESNLYDFYTSVAPVYTSTSALSSNSTTNPRAIVFSCRIPLYYRASNNAGTINATDVSRSKQQYIQKKHVVFSMVCTDRSTTGSGNLYLTVSPTSPTLPGYSTYWNTAQINFTLTKGQASYTLVASVKDELCWGTITLSNLSNFTNTSSTTASFRANLTSEYYNGGTTTDGGLSGGGSGGSGGLDTSVSYRPVPLEAGYYITGQITIKVYNGSSLVDIETIAISNMGQP